MVYTAQAYVDHIQSTAERAGPESWFLASMVRCQHLTMFGLSAAASPEADKLLLGGLTSPLKLLLALRQARRGCEVDAGMIADHIPLAPFAWRQQQRVFRHNTLRSSGVQKSWAVDVASIRQMCGSCVQQRVTVSCTSPATPPLGGCDWVMELDCEYVDGEQGARVSLYSRLGSLLAGTFVEDAYEMSCSAPGFSMVISTGTACRSHARRTYGRQDCFDLGVMAGGWNQEAWASKGLPAAGELVFTLRITSVGHWP